MRKDEPSDHECLDGPLTTRRDFVKRAGAAGVALAGLGGMSPLASAANARRYARNQRSKVKGAIVFRSWGVGPERKAIENRIKYFNTKYPNVTVKLQNLQKNGYEEFPALLAQIASGKAPDVLRVLNFQPTQLVAQGNALLPLDEFIRSDTSFNQADFTKAAWKGAKVGGKVYAIPSSGEPYCLYYNKAMFKKAGLPDALKTYKAGKLTGPVYASWVDRLQSRKLAKFGTGFEAWNYDVFIFMGGGEVLTPNHKVVIDRPRSASALQYMADFVNKKHAPSPNVIGGTAYQLFANQRLATFISGSWWAFYLPDTIKNKFPWSACGVPRVHGHEGVKLEIDAISISKQTKNPEAAWAFVKTVTDHKGLEIWGKIATPARKSVLTSKEFLSNPYVEPLLDMLDVAEFTPFTTKGSAVDTAAISGLSKMWDGKQSAAQATKLAKKKIEKALA
ncbi:MAG: extracellular solute-binding protein [Actinobacteria bacterium]|nr:extracellular solute-binding protein [Actinomycetota bacterium]